MCAVNSPLIVAVDGGGSTCRAAIARLDGHILGRAFGGSANVTTDFDGAYQTLTACVAQAYREAGLDAARADQDVAYVGLAGANVGDAARRMERRLAFARTRVTSDRDITVEGALGPGHGTVALMGTGSFFVCRGPKGTRSVGGWGFQVGDDFSAAWAGRELLRHAILAYDGLAPASALTGEVLAHFGGHPDGVVTFAQSATPKDYAAFAQWLTKAAAQNDAVARALLGKAAQGLESLLGTIGTAQAGPLCLMGGFGPHLRAFLSEPYQALCVPPLGDGIAGAIGLATRAFAEDLP